MLGSKKVKATIDEKIVQPVQNAVMIAWTALVVACIALFAVLGSA